jgi:DNA-binding GntR family transcriptional regulator
LLHPYAKAESMPAEIQPPQKLPPSHKLRPATTVSWILENLRKAILEGSLQAHTLIRQDELAVAYGVSRMPIREAIRLLEAEGLVISRPNRGAVVAPLDPEDCEEIFDVRAALESLACRRSIPRLDEKQRSAAAAALDALESAPPEKASAAHRAFHLSLHAAAGSRLVRLIGQHIDAADRYLQLEATVAGTQEKDAREHRAILKATLDRDINQAAHLISEHVTDTGNEMARLLRQRSASRKPA